MTLSVPSGGPLGFWRVSLDSGTCQVVLHQSEHHSQTFPDVLYSPNPFGANAVTGAVETKPSSAVFRTGNSPCQMLQRCLPRGVSSSPHGNLARSRPPRAARSHSASVGSRLPAQLAYAVASFHDTCTTG